MKIYDFGRLSDGRRAGLYILTNSNGMTASVTDYGATLVSLYVPDSTGVRRDVVLGHDDVKGYEVGRGTIGASVGRFANRIAGARFTIGARSFVLTANHGPNALHGGRDFYSKRMWTARIPFAKISARDIMAGITESMNDGAAMRPGGSIGGDSITFCLDSPDGDQGFPGNLHVEVTYTLTDENELHIDYLARTDRDTALNLTNHSYFNLGGHDSGSVLEHEVRINAGAFTPNDKWSLPTGELRAVAGTPMDFRVAKTLGRDIEADDEQLRFGNGYDHNFSITGSGYREAAEMYCEESGIRMTVLTDLPGLQLYTANGMKDEPGKGGAVYGRRCAAAFETQYFPDAINKFNFEGGLLRAGEEFRSRTTYAFSF